jgi:disulfide bond formation protein DsbB
LNGHVAFLAVGPTLASTVPAATLFFALLAVFANVAVLVALVLWIGGRFSPALARAGSSLRMSVEASAIWFAWIVALVCTVGSLYLSEVAHFKPCVLCWYQRICMYPLAVLLLVAAVKGSREIARATLPLIAIGGSISIYHYLLERFPSMAGAGTCDPSAPCTLVWIWKFHYLSIPAMALSGFALIAVLILTVRRQPAEA